MTTQLETYLAYYVGCQNPGYAVLVTGNWGTGKTFQVKKALPENERYYVSLFGLQNTDEVFSAVFAQMFPLAAKVKKAVGSISETNIEVPGIATFGLGGLASGIANALLRNEVKTDRTLIFDDLERCGLDLKNTLGVINRYVEHHGCRVIVIAHDEKLAEDFCNAKEKLFGQTIAVEPQLTAAYDMFASPYLSIKNSLLTEYRDEILNIFKASEAKSLRVLKHVIEDLYRLQNTLSNEHLMHQEAMLELIRVFTALNIEARIGTLKREDLRNRHHTGLAFSLKNFRPKEGEPQPIKPPLLQAAERYKSINLESTILNDETLVKMLIDGSFETSQIQAALDDNAYFLKPTVTPAWKIFIQFDELEDAVAEDAMQALIRQFNNHEVIEPGEMLHLFALRFMMVENKLITSNHKTVEQECKLYIDSLLNQKRLPPQPFEWDPHESLNQAHDGYTYWLSASYKAEFHEVYKHLLDARKRALVATFSERASSLLRLVETDGNAFFEETTYTHSGNNTYAGVPILASIDKAEFVAAWMRSHPKNWTRIQSALTSRYQSSASVPFLKEEAAWVKSVKAELMQEIEKASGIRKLRLERALPDVP